MSTENELFNAVDSLLQQVDRGDLPAPAERRRLREEAGLTQQQIAQALATRTQSVGDWEAGRREPRPPKRDAYARLLEGLAARFPAPAETAEPVAAPVPETFTTPTAPEQVPPAPRLERPTEVAATPAPRVPAPSTSRRPGAQKAAQASSSATRRSAGDFVNGPLAVIDVGSDGKVSAYCVGGLVLDVPAKSLMSLVQWTLSEAKLGAARLNANGKDADPLVVLTDAAAERFGLPTRLSDEERRAGRLPEGHKIVKQVAQTDYRLTKRGFGPWARIYRPAEGNKRFCVQLCILGWDALDSRSWGNAALLEPPALAHLLGVYASRVMTPRGSTAVIGQELMTAMRPPTRAVEGEQSGEWVSGHNPGSLGSEPVEAAPPEVPDGHPLLAHLPRFYQRTPAEVLIEEAYDWSRPLTDAECRKRFVVGIDVNMAFAAGANGTYVGLGAPVHVHKPKFDKALPGSWLVDLSHIELDPRLPSPFTPHGERPEGPAWYATPTVAYAVELGYDVHPIEAYVRPENGRYLDDWYKRLRNAYVATMADLGVTASMSPEAFLEAMAVHKQANPEMAIVLSAVKATVKGGIGKLRERPHGGGWRPGEPWNALKRPTWRPDIRAAVIATTRINMHRKMLNLANATGQFPVAVLSDCAVYPSDGQSPLDVLPYTPDGKTVPGSFRLGVSPGMVKHEGTQSTFWAESQREEYGADLNLARYIKDGVVSPAKDGEE
ncbi:helix-turn-helix domain-containing protein (plasmid) [Actinacidiphila glaucinigra]|uniref:telomere-associated protein Tap n=1 Tax=Actinacidiphila glaucinigra TaxID=235986 RepID=UPI002DDBE73E|nr:helix-turn-helix domain-containing protein [Actinacidiphila glaucinigra]WSD65993.1 helix-turn-helix domain-containing protein [Actinacidiphila glaucinigra]